jgi:hypothetical protein
MILVYIHCISMSLLLKIPVAGGSLGNRLREYVILRILYIYITKNMCLVLQANPRIGNSNYEKCGL